MHNAVVTTPGVAGPPTGLTAAQVAHRVARGEVNRVADHTSRTLAEILRANVLTRFNAILGALFVLVMLTGSWRDGLFGVVLVVNSGIGVVQEYLAARTLDRLALLHAPTAHVVRDGTLAEVPVGDVVLDDVVELRTGDQVPADGPLLTASGLELDESNLTGEADPVPHAAGEAVRSGTAVVAGSARMRAEAVGAAAYVNRIAADARRFQRTRSEIQASTNTLLRYITWVIVAALPLTLWSQWRTVGDQGWRQVVIRAAAGLVGLVPEGLVLLTSLAFLLSAVQLARRQVLVQQLPAVEVLARVDVVCVDKTGTLTSGRISLEDVIPLGAGTGPPLGAVLGALADDPNANATLLAVATAAPAPGWRRTGEVPFTSARTWSAATFEGHGTWVLGAPEALRPGDTALADQVAGLAATGRRVVLLARASSLPSGGVLPPDLEPAGLVTLTEQVRADAAETLAYLAGQGVQVMVVSGDNPVTVAAVARAVGLDPGQPVDARTLGDDPEHLRALVATTRVFGRVSPEQKRAIVRALQAEGHVVAMTGDGVNDALALKDADLGIAMGSGAPATRAVAELVLLDGRFSRLPRVLAEGRRVIGNVERVANLFVAKNAMSLVAILASALVALPFPFLPRHLTLVSAVTIGIPSFVLALGPNRRRYVPGFLRRVLRFAVPAGAVAGVCVIASYLVVGLSYGVPKDQIVQRCGIGDGAAGPVDVACWQSSTAATTTLLVVFFWILAVLARPWRAWKVALVVAMVALAAAALFLPAGRSYFSVDAPLPLVLESLAIGVVGGLAVELVHRWASRAGDAQPGAALRPRPAPPRRAPGAGSGP